MIKTKNKIMSMMLVLCMVVSLLPATNMTAFAAEVDTFTIKTDLRNTPGNLDDDIDMDFKVLTEPNGDVNGTVQVGDGRVSIAQDTDGEITIPSTVTYNEQTYNIISIGNYAFVLCESLTSITIPENVTSIGDGAFSECTSLTSITIPENVTSIGENTFGLCGSLTSITIPENVTSIGQNAFLECRSLTSITIPKNVTSIGKYAFAWCERLKSITIPASVNFIGDNAFDSSDNLEFMYFDGSMPTIGIKSIPSSAKVYYDASANGWERNPYNAKSLEINVTPDYYTVANPTVTALLSGMMFPVTTSELSSQVGTHTVTVSGSGDEPFVVEKEYTILQSGTDFSVRTFNGNSHTTEFTYGDTITVKVTPQATGASPYSLIEPIADQMALYVHVNDTYIQITEPQTVTNGEELTFTINTADKTIPSTLFTDEEQDLYIRYLGNENMAYHEESVVITLNQKRVSWDSDGEVADKVYDGNTNATVKTEPILDGVLDGDDVTVKPGTVEFIDKMAGNNKYVEVRDYGIEGEDAVYYKDPSAFPTDQPGFNDPVITAKTLTEAMVNDIANHIYTGSEIEPTVTLTDGEPSIITTSDYTVDYSENTNAGIATITITGTQNYTGTVTKDFTIEPKAITPTIDPITAQPYTGSQITPAIIVKNGDTTLTTDDYDVTYGENLNVVNGANTDGSVTVTIKGNYSGTATANFDITPVDYTNTKTTTGSTTYGTTGEVDLSAWGNLVGASFVALAINDDNNILDGTLTIADNKLSFTFVDDDTKIGDTATITIPVTSTNYNQFDLTVTLTVTPDTTELKEAITNAEAAKDGIITDDGTPDTVKNGVKFVSKSVMTAFDNAIEQAKTTLANATSVKEVNDAISDINSAIKTFEDAIQTGTLKYSQTLTFSKDDVAATVGESFTEPTLSGAKTNVTYISTNENVATVNAKGEVTILKAGTTTIVATAEETTDYYSGADQYALKIEEKAPTSVDDIKDYVASFDVDFAQIAKIIFNNVELKLKKIDENTYELSGYPSGDTVVIGRAVNGSVVVTLNEEFLKSLPHGNYSLSVTTTQNPNTPTATLNVSVPQGQVPNPTPTPAPTVSPTAVPTPTISPTQAPSDNVSPDTGDNSNVLLYLIIALMSLAGIGYVSYRKKAQNR